jgi:hypothetical protein
MSQPSLLTALDYAEFIYDTLRECAVNKDQLGEALSAMLEYKTNDKFFQRIVIIMTMIHAHEE